MRKHAVGLDPIEDDHPPGRLPRRLFVALPFLAVSPFLYEGVLICVGNWQAAMGASSNVRTPFLDAARDLVSGVRDELASLVPVAFQHIPWQPSHVLLVAAVAMAASMRMLRR